MVGPAAEDDTVRVDAMPSAATATAAATAATNPHVTSNRGSEDERVDALVESLLRGRQRQQQLPDSETISRMYSSVSGGDEAPGASSGGVIGRGSNSNSQDTRLGVRTDSTMASQTAAGETGVRFGDSDVSAPFSLGRDAVRARGSTSDAASTRRNDLWPGSDGVGSTSRVRRPRRVSERGTGSIDGGGGRDRDRRRGTPPIQTAVATAFIRDEMQASNADIANSVELVLEQLLVGGGLLPAGLLAGAVGGGGGQGRNATGVGDDDGGGNAEGGAGDGQVGARGHGGGGARAAATRGGGIGRRGARSGGPGRQMTLLEAIRAGGGRPPSQLTDVFIGPGMRVTGGGGGGGEGGITGVRLGNALGSGLGAFMRGFALAGGVGGAGGPGGNVGDYAFGDLSQLIQQLMAADPNRHGPPPASKEIVDALPTIQVAKGSRLEGTECAVCKDDFAAGETVRELPCTHAFHQHCILPWLAERNTCPTCRYELPTDENSTVNNIMSDMNGMNGILTSDDNGNVNDATADGRRGGGEGARGGAEGDAPRPGEDAAEATSWSLSPSLSGQGARRRSSGEEASTAFTFHDPPGAA